MDRSLGRVVTGCVHTLIGQISLARHSSPERNREKKTTRKSHFIGNVTAHASHENHAARQLSLEKFIGHRLSDQKRPHYVDVVHSPKRLDGEVHSWAIVRYPCAGHQSPEWLFELRYKFRKGIGYCLGVSNVALVIGQVSTVLLCGSCYRC